MIVVIYSTVKNDLEGSILNHMLSIRPHYKYRLDAKDE